MLQKFHLGGGQGVVKLKKRCVHKNWAMFGLNALISGRLKMTPGKGYSFSWLQIQEYFGQKKAMTEKPYGATDNGADQLFAHIVSQFKESFYSQYILLFLDLAFQEGS